MNKKRILLGVIFFLIGVITQIIGLNLFCKVSAEVFCMVAFSSSVPIAISVFNFSQMIPEKLKVIKYILYFYISLILLIFVLVCIFALTVGFNVQNGALIV